MGCFCHATLGPLTLALPQLSLSEQLNLQGAAIPLSLSAWLSARGMPSLPWQPDPNWLTLPLPRLQLSMQAVATISAMAQLRAQVLAQFGIDLLLPGQARAFARIIATLNARLSMLASLHANFNPLAWIQLARLSSAIDQVQLALQAGLLAPPANLMLSLTLPGGLPMVSWRSLLAQLRMLAPMIAALAQLNISVSETAQLSAALRALVQLQLPALVAPQFMASVTAALSAVAQLQASLGLTMSPLSLGFPALVLRVQAKLALLLPALSAHLGINLGSGASLASLIAELLALLPNLPVMPTSLATSEVVQAALRAQVLASLNWQVPATLPSLQIALPACAFAAQLSAALGINAVLPSPCASGCDAASLMHALESV
jgi:hypothetical protein